MKTNWFTGLHRELDKHYPIECGACGHGIKRDDLPCHCKSCGSWLEFRAKEVYPSWSEANQ